MNDFTLFFMYDMVWVTLLAIIYATYALLSKPKGDKAVRLTIGFAFAYYLVFFLLSFATSIATARVCFYLYSFQCLPCGSPLPLIAKVDA